MKLRKNKKGFTLIEGLVALFVFSILVVTFYKIFTGSMIHMQDSKYRRGAVELANERMEQFRNIAYENIVTKVNAGDIEDDEIVDVNGLKYRIIISVFFVDDPIDGTAAGGDDVRYEDYKRVKVTIVWGNAVSDIVPKADAVSSDKYKSKRVSVVSQFVPPGGMEAMPTGGILSINVIDSSANPIEPVGDATVSIMYDSCQLDNPPANCGIVSEVPVVTQSDGNYSYIGAKICAGCYDITITKSGYETRKTLEPFTSNNLDGIIGEGEFNPYYSYQGVSVGNITSIAFNTNKTSQLKITTRDPFEDGSGNGLIGDVAFDIIGGLSVGTDSDTGDEIPSINQLSVTTDATSAEIDVAPEIPPGNGVSSIDNINALLDGNYVPAGLYTISNILFPSGHENDVFWKFDPNYNDRYQVSVEAGTDVEANMIILDDDYDGIFVKVVEIVDGESVPVQGVDVKLQNLTLSTPYDVTLVTDEFGYIYFPRDTDDVTMNNFGDIIIADGANGVLTNGETYDLIIEETADYNGINESVTVNGLEQKNIEIVKK